MKKAVLFTPLLLLAGTLMMAQDAPSSDAGTTPHDQSPAMSAQSSTSQNTMVRGCLSGSPGNFTLTDQSGMQYKLMGSDVDLQSRVGHEVQISGTQTQATETSSGNGESMAHAANSLQVSGVRDISRSCSLSEGQAAQPLNNAEPNEETGTKGSPTTTEPPRPQEMAMLTPPRDSQATTGTTTPGNNGTSSATDPNSQSSQTGQSATQTGQSGAAAPTAPPVTSQTPAAPASPTSSQGQVGASPANSASTPSAADNPNAASPATSSTTPAAGTNDANKPLYERPATDIPGSSGSNGTPATTNSNPQ